MARAPASCASYPRRDPDPGGPCVSRRLTRRARKLPNIGPLSPHTSAVQAINVGWWCAMTRRVSSEVAGAHTLDSSEALPSMEGFLARWWCLTCLQFPRLYLCLSVLHPIRRHYTPSERVRCPLTGVLPPNGCVAPQWVRCPAMGALPPNGCRVFRAVMEACPSSADFSTSRLRSCTRLRRLGVFDREVRLGRAATPGRCRYACCHPKFGSFLPPGIRACR